MRHAPDVAGAQVDLEATDIAIVDSRIDQADAVVRILARPARSARDAEHESEAEAGVTVRGAFRS
ncbi:MAG TPA: hypothetical protein VI542_20630 [Candidatus Tectomicrobia bacterium]